MNLLKYRFPCDNNLEQFYNSVDSSVSPLTVGSCQQLASKEITLNDVKMLHS